MNIGLAVTTAGLTSGLAQAKAGLSGFVSSLGPVAPALAGVAVGIAGLNALWGEFTDSLSRVDELGAAADKIGVTVESLSALQFAAGQSDVEITTLQGGLQKLGLNLGQAVNGSDKATKAFSDLGLNAQSLANMGTTEAFQTIAERISQIKNPAQQAAAAVAIFGKSGAELLPLLKVGGEGIAELTKRADELGLVMSGDQVKGIKEANDAIGTLGMAWDAVFNSIAALVAPVLTEVFGAITTFVSNTRKTFGLIYDVVKSVLGGITKLLGPFVQPFVKAAQFIWDAFTTVFGGIVQGFVDAFNYVAEALGMDQITNPFSEAASKLNADTSSITGGVVELAEGMTEAGKAAEEAQKKIEEVANKVQGLTTDWQTQLATQGLNSREVEIYKLKAMGATSAQIAGLEELNAQLKAQEDQLKRNAELQKIDDLANGWQKQIDTMGLAGRELEIYNAKLAGATDEQIANLEKLNAKLKESETAQKLKADGEALKESLATPLQKYEKELERLQTLLSSGAIDQETFDRGRAKAFGDLDSASGSEATSTPRFAGAMSAGSVDVFKTLATARSLSNKPSDPMSRLAQIQEKELKESQRQTQLLTQLARTTTDQESFSLN